MLYVKDLLKFVSLKPALVMQFDYKTSSYGWMNLLGPTPEAQIAVLENIIYKSLIDFEVHCLHDQLRVINVSTQYQYKFEDIIADTDEGTYPIPKTIAYLKAGTGNTQLNVNPWVAGSNSALLSDFGGHFNARLWNYQKPYLHCQYTGQMLVRSYCNRPYVVNVTNDNKFTEDSRIYFFDKHANHFINQFYLNILQHVKFVKESVQTATNVNFLANIDEQIQRVDAEVDQFYRTYKKSMSMWRK